ncbi:MAG: histidinol-phosphatase [Rhizobiaceae bacterium]
MSEALPDSETLRSVLDDACAAAARETLPRFRADTAVDNKLTAGFDPVTEADRAAEAAIRRVIETRFPSHDIVGEEHGKVDKGSRFQWIIDPIDGTRAFISGIPVWGTLIGLYRNDIPLAGVLAQPFTRERFVALPDGGGKAAWLHLAKEEPKRLKTRRTVELAQATLMTTSPDLLQSTADKPYFKVEEKAKLVRYGCDCYAYAMIAAGQIDLVLESGLNIYDIAALIPIVEGAGGLVTNWQGGSAAQGGQILAAANPAIHRAAMDVLNAPD